MRERPVAGRRQPDDPRCAGRATALLQAVRRGVGGLARSAGQQQLAGIEEAVVGEEIVEQEGGAEQRLQDSLQAFGVLLPGGIVGPDVLLVGGRQLLAVR